MNDIHIDIEDIRREPEKYRQAIADKHIDLDLDELLDLDNKRRAMVYEIDLLRAERNKKTAAVKSKRSSRSFFAKTTRR
jgi:seryl-tRNA synthetase